MKDIYLGPKAFTRFGNMSLYNRDNDMGMFDMPSGVYRARLIKACSFKEWAKAKSWPKGSIYIGSRELGRLQNIEVLNEKRLGVDDATSGVYSLDLVRECTWNQWLGRKGKPSGVHKRGAKAKGKARARTTSARRTSAQDSEEEDGVEWEDDSTPEDRLARLESDLAKLNSVLGKLSKKLGA